MTPRVQPGPSLSAGRQGWGLSSLGTPGVGVGVGLGRQRLRPPRGLLRETMEAGRLAGNVWGVHSSCAGELVPPKEEGPGVVLASLLLPGKQFQGQSRASEGGLSVRTGDVGPGAFTPRLSWNSLRWALEEGLRGWLRAFLASTLGSSASSLCSPFTWKQSLQLPKE